MSTSNGQLEVHPGSKRKAHIYDWLFEFSLHVGIKAQKISLYVQHIRLQCSQPDRRLTNLHFLFISVTMYILMRGSLINFLR